jgi:energy-converting hydrogenase A subunit R
MEEFSAKNIFLIANSQTTLRHVQSIADAFIVSTSYEHYIRALCKAVDFPYKNTYCTKVRLDKCAITPKEKDRLREVAQEITEMHLIDIPSGAKTVGDFSQADQATIGRLNEVFWSKIPEMFVGKFLVDVVTVGGEQKAESIRHAVQRLGSEVSDVMYVGDSITDVEAFKLVRSDGGLAVSFNGNSYAVKNAEVAVLAESNLVTAIIADLFCRFGKEKALETIQNWNIEGLKKSGADPALLKQFLGLYSEVLPKVVAVTAKNAEALTKESCEYRKKVRGVAIGKLG